ncbi:hypothetical protein BOTBODRAFT_32716 [Botryobasidium botryosum FD-172 SS1]|uniref:STAS domain-containing protein n=1 Tax=Botryobasidium botryosum (strain FD-172 SS1) TaxID=930990 RepID=A0A067MRT6_BOTB1|nr:hypothetical protein BOTBODRAFT_32716 [Botryobasidium botryosum FD-172 SS1]
MESTKRFLRRVLDIPPELDENHRRITGADSVASSHTAHNYIEPLPTVDGWLRDIIPDRAGVVAYLRSLLPFIEWLPRYNRIWLMGDLVAGVTVGAVVVPQGMAYAKLANLPVEFGLYSSFVGVLIYWFFATSKDITIGPVAVMSTLIGHIILEVQARDKSLSGQVIASAVAVLAGSFVFVLGMFRLGFIVDFIPLPAIGAFMTGSALNIAAGQVPGMMGITGFDTRASTYLVIINTLKHLGRSNLNAAMGLTALAMLYIIRSFCNWMARRRPNQAKGWFFVSTLRTAFVILLYTMISWLVNRHHRKNPKFSILGSVPRGFKHMGVPTINKRVVQAIAPNLPASVIVLLIEHIAISKSFGRVNNYTINPSQELIAIGITNIFGPFFGAYPATGSFSRTAIKSKAGVRTPLAGVITALVVLLAIYALPPVFFYIPNASLAGVIIHAVGDLITPPKSVYAWWLVSPAEVIIFFAGVIGSVFGTIEIGIYTTIAVTGALLLYRIAKAHGDFVGRIRVYGADGYAEPRNIFIPIDHADGSNPSVPVEAPTPGVFIFRLRENIVYANANQFTDALVEKVFNDTKPTSALSFPRLGDRPWNHPGPRHIDPSTVAADPRPTLKAIILDFSAVSQIDVTAVQNLQDVRDQLDRHAAPHKVEWHFAAVNRPWVKRALVAGGFGRLRREGDGGGTKPLFSVTDVGGVSKFKTKADLEDERIDREGGGEGRADEEDPVSRATAALPVFSVDFQAFHLDIEDALAYVDASLGSHSDRSPGQTKLEDD